MLVMKIVASVLRGVYMLAIGIPALCCWAVCGMAVLIFVAVVWMRAAEFALLVYRERFTTALLVSASIAMLALFFDRLGRRRSRTLMIKTQNGFWSSLAAAVVFATFFGLMTAAHVKRSGSLDHFSPVVAVIAISLLLSIFLLPAVRNLYEVWRASLRFKSRDRAASRQGTSLPSAVEFQKLLPALSGDNCPRADR